MVVTATAATTTTTVMMVAASVMMVVTATTGIKVVLVFPAGRLFANARPHINCTMKKLDESCDLKDEKMEQRHGDILMFKGELVEEHLKLLIKNFGDVLQFQKALGSSQKEEIKLVQEKLEFLKNFLFFVSKLIVEHEKLQAVVDHIGVVADIATTYVSFPCLGNTSDKDMTNGVLFDLIIQTIKPNKPEVTKAYVLPLKGLDLNEVLESQARTFVKDHFETLHKELRFILTFLISPPEQPTMVGKLDDVSAVIEATVIDADSIVHRFQKKEMNENSAKESELAVIGLLKKVESIKPKSGEIYLNLPTKSIFPEIGVLGFINSLFENVQQLLDSKIDSIALVKHQLETLLQELEFFKSFLKDAAYLHEDDEMNTMFVKTQIFDKKTSALRDHESPSVFASEENSSLFDEELVGFEDEAQTIVAKLIKGPAELDIISIVGMPALEKQRLPRKCSMMKVFLSTSRRMDEEQQLAHELKKRLQRRRYLIVTDDMWKTDVWDDFKMCFPDNNNGSRIIMTTRFNEVALYAKQCNKCQGLPLFIILVAGILGNMEVKPNCRIEDKANSWKRVTDSLSSKLVSDREHNWMDLLELSYKHLPHHLKSCFLYFGAFLEDQEIPVSKLIMLWISEGFVQKAESKKQEDIAEEYLMNLISRNLVMVAKRRSIGGVKSCRVHDLLHKFCLEKAEEESLLHVTTSLKNKFLPFPIVIITVLILMILVLQRLQYYMSNAGCNQFPVLDFLNQLESLKVLYDGTILSPCKFSFPSNLKKLTLSKFRLPWSEICALENLEVLKLAFKAFEGDQWDVNDG
ncbi:putative late blight resistance protein homolog R1B-17 [Lycium ferocissimum]|uniref:putative late blight resistance protein homolog R1B-17 n=1 Tax=Lycium ferocissimum TaxID=112874 RepID=UPI002815300C|nr:putative late blight resistance protein homolog R1B-17 [Lycium ferocissimum]